MNKVIRGALFIAAIYCVGTYYFDRPEEIKQDVAALQEISAELPEPEQVLAGAKHTGEYAEKTVFRAKQRLDLVRANVSESIATGAERFTGAD
ncbi:MAG: hypothetical protein GY944_06090 [bacterium]|nr:hypothetical protein [bacterium]MCP5040581.1 hypothetical protein [bacterium]